MGLFSFLSVRGKDEDDGACLIWKCPQCEKEQVFHLVIGSVQLGIKGGPSLDCSELLADLRCKECRYDFRVPIQERESVEQVRELTQKLWAGSLTKETYKESIQALPMKFIKDMLALTQEWKCGECGENNPVTFGNCWKCQTKKLKASVPDEDAKPLQGFRTHTNPWEY